jgi:hypothetical protein
MSTTFALSRLISGERVPSAEKIPPVCDIQTESPSKKLRHASRELRAKITSNPINLDTNRQVLEIAYQKTSKSSIHPNRNKIN